MTWNWVSALKIHLVYSCSSRTFRGEIPFLIPSLLFGVEDPTPTTQEHPQGPLAQSPHTWWSTWMRECFLPHLQLLSNCHLLLKALYYPRWSMPGMSTFSTDIPFDPPFSPWLQWNKFLQTQRDMANIPSRHTQWCWANERGRFLPRRHLNPCCHCGQNTTLTLWRMRHPLGLPKRTYENSSG